MVDVSWAAITLLEENEIRFLALSSEIGSAWQAGERLPLKATATEWVATHKKTMVEQVRVPGMRRIRHYASHES